MVVNSVLMTLVGLSGLAALVYEVSWIRLMTLLMGHSAGAVGTVLAAFMGGLALGAGTAGRVAQSMGRDRALRVYALLELAIGVSGLLLPTLVDHAAPLLSWAYDDGQGGLWFSGTRVALSFAVLAVPTIAMGASFPVAIRCLQDARAPAAGGASRLYAANTVGAACGAALAGFVWLPQLGLAHTTQIAAILNATVCLIAWWLSRTTPPTMSTRTDTGASTTNGRSAHQGIRTWCAVALGLSGFVALALEVTWTRILGTVLGPTSYAFSTMLVSFITGLAAGSSACALVAPRVARPGIWLGAALVVVALAGHVATMYVDQIPLVMATAVTRPGAEFGSVFSLQVGLIAVVLLPMTLALGATFPLALAYAAPKSNEVTSVSSLLYGSNTLGAIAGSLAASFVLIPWVGLQSTSTTAALLALGTAAVLFWHATGPGLARWVGAGVVGVAGVALAATATPWNVERLAAGAYRFASALATGDIATELEAGRLLYYREGAAGTVSVRELPGVRSLAIDGKVDASNAGDMLTQKLLAHLPLLLHDQPKRVAIIGLGSGVTAGAALRHPVDRVDVIELSPEVVAASELFASENTQALRDPRTRLIVGDGRSHLALTRERYDVIVSEPSNPWMAGVATLFTREFFATARGRLTPTGLLCQWAHTYNISDSDLRSIVATFLSVFPEGTAWLVGDSDLLLVGSPAPITALDHGIETAWNRPGVKADLAEVDAHDPFAVLSTFVARGPSLGEYAGDAPLQSDDRLALEYSAPRAIYGRFQEANVEHLTRASAAGATPRAVAAAMAAPTSTEWRNRGLMLLRASAPDRAYADLQRALQRAPDDAATLDAFTSAATRARRLEDATQWLAELATRHRHVRTFTALSALLASQGHMQQGLEAARQAIDLESSDGRAWEQLVSIYADEGDVDAVTQVVSVLESSAPSHAALPYCRARLAFLRGALEETASHARALIERGRPGTDAWNLLGTVRVGQGRFDEARKAFEASLVIEPRDARILTNLGIVELQAGAPHAAADRFAEALSLQPTLGAALDGLAQAFDRLGRTERASAVRRLAEGAK